LADPPGIAAAGSPLAVSLEKRQSAGGAAAAALEPGPCRPVAGEFRFAGGPCGAAFDFRALRDLSLWLGHHHRRPDAGVGRHLLDGGAGDRDRPDRAALWRTPG